MVEREIDGIVVKDSRQEGLTVREVLRSRFPDIFESKPKGHLWWKKQRPVFKTPGLYFEAIPFIRISGDRKHVIATGQDEGRLFLTRDEEVFLGGDFDSLNVLATSPDFSRLVVVSQDPQGIVSLHLIDEDRIETPFEGEGRKNVVLLKHSEGLDRLLIETVDVNDKKSLHFFDHDHQVGFLKKTVCAGVDDFRILYYDDNYDDNDHDYLLISAVDGKRIVFGVFNPNKTLLREFGIPTPLDLQKVSLVAHSHDFSVVIWRATMDGSECVFKNGELLAKGAKQWCVEYSPDFSQVLAVSGEEDEARIILNGQEIHTSQAKITSWDYDEKITHVVAVLSDGKNKPPRLFYMSPQNSGVLDLAFEDILVVEAYKDCIVAEVVRDGVKRRLTIRDSQSKQVPGVAVKPTTA